MNNLCFNTLCFIIIKAVIGICVCFQRRRAINYNLYLFCVTSCVIRQDDISSDV